MLRATPWNSLLGSVQGGRLLSRQIGGQHRSVTSGPEVPLEDHSSREKTELQGSEGRADSEWSHVAVNKSNLPHLCAVKGGL